MLEPSNNNELPAIPGKRYFTIGEVSELCAVKPHVLRYWEQEFPSSQPRQAPRQPPLLPARRCSTYSPDSLTALRTRLYHWRRPSALEGETTKQEQTPYKQLIDQTISELEAVLTMLDKAPDQNVL